MIIIHTYRIKLFSQVSDVAHGSLVKCVDVTCPLLVHDCKKLHFHTGQNVHHSKHAGQTHCDNILKKNIEYLKIKYRNRNGQLTIFKTDPLFSFTDTALDVDPNVDCKTIFCKLRHPKTGNAVNDYITKQKTQ